LYSKEHILLRDTGNSYFNFPLFSYCFERYETIRVEGWKLTQEYPVNALKNDRFKKGGSCRKCVTKEPAMFILFLIKILAPKYKSNRRKNKAEVCHPSVVFFSKTIHEQNKPTTKMARSANARNTSSKAAHSK